MARKDKPAAKPPVKAKRERRKRRLLRRVVTLATRLKVRREDMTQAEADEVLRVFETMTIQDFFDWLLENWPEILEMIMAIIMLF
jgi:hypothetical protein